MSEIDYVVPRVVVEWDGKFDLKDIYAFTKEWILNRKYDLGEKEYHTTETENGDTLRIKWWAFKKIDDYSKFNIEILFLGKGLKRINNKKHELVEGFIRIEIESYIEKDYENVWSNKPLRKFYREIYDKFFLRGKFDKYHEELKDETLMIRDDLKKFFNALKY